MIFGFSGDLFGSVMRLFGAAEELLLVGGTVETLATLGRDAPVDRKARKVAGFGAALLAAGLLGAVIPAYPGALAAPVSAGPAPR